MTIIKDSIKISVGDISNMVEIKDILKNKPDSEDDEEGIYRISEKKHQWFQQKMKHINKIAKEVGAEPVKVDYLESYFVQAYGENVYDPSTGRILAFGPIPGKSNQYFKIRLTGETPKFKGWEFIATVTGTPNGNILSKVPGYIDNLPEQYRSGNMVCEYCGKARRRINTFIVKSQETGEFQAVGRNCLGKFLGSANPANIANMATWAYDIEEELSGDDDELKIGGSSHDPYLGLDEFLAITSAVVEKHGWVSRTAAMDNESLTSTVARVIDQIYPNYKDKNREIIKIEDRHREKAKEIIDFARSDALSTNTDYKNNLKVVTAGPVFNEKFAGIVASLVNFTDRSLEQEKEMAAKRAQWAKEKEERLAERKKSEFLGEIGQRITVPVRVVYHRLVESDFRPSYYIVKMETPNRDQLTWFASNWIFDDDYKDKWYNLTATVKNHETYEGVKQTVVTRGKAESVVERDARESVSKSRYTLAGKSSKKKSTKSTVTVGGTR